MPKSLAAVFVLLFWKSSENKKIRCVCPADLTSFRSHGYLPIFMIIWEFTHIKPSYGRNIIQKAKNLYHSWQIKTHAFVTTLKVQHLQVWVKKIFIQLALAKNNFIIVLDYAQHISILGIPTLVTEEAIVINFNAVSLSKWACMEMSK